MSQRDRHYVLSREEIGILLSFARRPEAATQVWIDRLQGGVTHEELLDFFTQAGLPLSTASRIMSAETTVGRPVDDTWSQRSTSYRRAVAGLLTTYVVIAILFGLLAGRISLSVPAGGVAFAGSAFVLYKVIVRLSPGPKPAR